MITFHFDLDRLAVKVSFSCQEDWNKFLVSFIRDREWPNEEKEEIANIAAYLLNNFVTLISRVYEKLMKIGIIFS